MNDGSLSLAAWSYGLAGVAYAGYEHVSTVRLQDPASAPALSLWQLDHEISA